MSLESELQEAFRYPDFILREALSAAAYLYHIKPNSQRNVVIPVLGYSTQNEETRKMLKVKTIHMIDGRNIVDMTQDDMISVIANAENDISNLEALTTESRAVTKKIKALEEGIAAVVIHLDKKAS